MAAKITVNGIAYDGVDAMPPEVRQMYQQTLARLPELADRDGDGLPDIVQGTGLSLKRRMKVEKKFVVNGTTYDDMESMPPDVRRACEDALRAAKASEPTVKRNEIKMSFKIAGPGFSFGKTFGASSPPPKNRQAELTSAPEPIKITSSPIGPSSTEGAIRFALIIGGLGIIGLVLWFLTRPH